MRYPRMGVTIVLAMVANGGCTPMRVKEPESIPVSVVISEVEGTLAKVQEKNANIAWKTVELTLETVVKKGTESSFEFLVVSAEASVTDSVTQTVYYKLIPKHGILEGLAVPLPFSEQLSNAIVRADADREKYISNSKMLASEGSSVSIKFAVETNKSGGAEVELVPVTVGVKGTRAKTAAHTIKITF